MEQLNQLQHKTRHTLILENKGKKKKVQQNYRYALQTITLDTSSIINLDIYTHFFIQSYITKQNIHYLIK